MSNQHPTRRLFEAIQCGAICEATRLLDEGADPNSVSAQGLSLVQHAIVHCQAAGLRLLLARGAAIDHVGSDTRSAACLAIVSMPSHHQATVDAVLQMMGDFTPLWGPDTEHRSAAADPFANETVFDTVLRASGRLDYRDEQDETLLHMAASMGRADIVRKLLDKGLDPDARDQYGRTPLHALYRSGCADTALALVKGGADVDAADQRECRALHVSVARAHVASASVLRALGASNKSVMSANEEMERILCAHALVCAVTTGSRKLVLHALQQHPDLASEVRLAALSWARRAGNQAIVTLLESWSAQQAARQAIEEAAPSAIRP